MSNRSVDFYEFGPFRLEPDERLLLRHGTRLSVPPKAFAALVILVERCGRVVGKEELMSAVWPETFVEENNLTQCIFTLRRLLDEKVNGQSLIETVPKLGYRFVGLVSKSPASPKADGMAYVRHSRARIVIREEEEVETDGPAREVGWPVAVPANGFPAEAKESAPHRATWKRRVIYVSAGAFLLVAAAICFLLWRPAVPPRVVDYVPLSKNVNPEGSLFTDGVHLYFLAEVSGGFQLAQMSAQGGDVAYLSEVPIPLKLTPVDLSPAGSEFLALKRAAGTAGNELWIMPLPAGSPRPVGNLKAQDAAWSPTGDLIVYAMGNNLYTAKNDGSEPHELVRLPGPAWDLRWSPNGKWIRFVVRTKAPSLWEVAADGTGLRRLLDDPGQTAGQGHWTVDGRYFVFPMRRNGHSDLWALRETSASFGAGGVEPVRLTNGQLELSAALPSRDGRCIYAVGMLQQVEILRHDASTNSFVPYLPGVSADSLAFSSDGQWVAYSAFPDRTLWRSRIDGSERMQLTFAPMETLLPRWSPDGAVIALAARSPGNPWNVYMVPASGGLPQPLAPSPDQQATPAWSPDGNVIAFAGAPWENGFAPNSTPIQLLDLRTRQSTILPGSESLWSPRWSPNGRYLVAETNDSQELRLFDFRERQWRPLARVSNAVVGYTAWSRDSESVYFNAYGDKGNGVYRVTVAGGQNPEQVLDLKRVPLADTLGQWFTLAPDGSALLLRDTSIRKIYALTLKSP
jgi:DNA-binding winged helix-turn-helix (wHTH) protein/Tol biopolymer transport system component